MSQARPAVVFDFGGVIFDWNPHYLYGKYFGGDLAAVDRFLEEIGFSAWNVEQDKGRTFAEAVAVLSARFPQHADLIRAYDVEYLESIGGVYQGTIDLLYRLHQAGYPLYALTNWPHEKFLVVRPKHAFLDLFIDIVVSGEVRLAKPDPRIFQLLLERNGLNAAESVYIDDAPHNVEAARALGFQVIHFRDAGQCAAELQALGILSPNGQGAH